MKKLKNASGFALVVTLVMMVMILLIVVGYLGITRTDRATTSTYANRLRAKIIADGGLASAIHLLGENTRYGNYITAMPPPAPAPAPRRTELYRPGISASNLSVNPTDYLRLSNAVGDILSSRADYTANPAPAVDPRPPPDSIPPAGPFAVSDPGFTTSNSYDFNQVIRLGTSSTGRLVNPDGQSALGQWVRVRNTAGELIGCYAFFIEDDSMKMNVNVAGNNMGASASNLRINDLILPATAPAPPTQIQETDPSAILATTANRTIADTTLANLGSAGNRIPSRSTLGLLTEWATTFPDYAHIATVLSRDDDTTALGWQRLDLNKIVGDAQTTGTAQAKKDAATKIANWIRDAWTGPTAIASLLDYQLYGDDWARKQIAANIVDYIDTDSAPTDVGDIIPAGFANAAPVIGIEKTPYLAGVHVIYEASGSTYPGAGAGTFNATIKLRIQFHFLNLSETTLDLAGAMGSTNLSRIEVSGVPIVQKNGSSVYDAYLQPWTVKLSDLTPVSGGTGTTVPPGVNGTSTSGARTFQTGWLDTQVKSFTVTSPDQRPKFLAGRITVKIIGNRTGIPADDYRVDDTAIVTSAVTTKWCNTCGSSPGDFLKESTGSTALQVASINYIAGYQGAIVFGATPGDPRYRGRLVSDRWNNDGSRTDASGTGNKLDSITDQADLNVRSYGFDWFDYGGDRPLAFTRNGPMLNIGELGNVATCEYPWRTLYLQYPERPASTTAAGPVTDIPLRRRATMDYILLDLFRTNSNSSRSGAININTQQRYGSTQQHALAPLFFGELVGTVPSLTQSMVDRLCTDTTAPTGWSTVLDRRVAVGLPPDNNPLRPFFQIGELASVVSRLVNTSVAGSGTTGSPGRSTVNYSLLRTNAIATSESPTNANIHRDMEVEQEFREVSNSITTRGNVFRILYVGQAIKDVNKNGNVDLPQDLQAEYLGEAFVERQGTFTTDPANSDLVRTTDSTYKFIETRVITE